MGNIGIVLVVSVSCGLLPACHGGWGRGSNLPPPAGQAGSSPETAGRATAAGHRNPGAPEGESKRAVTDVTVFHLHKMLRKIGVERDTFTPGGDGSMEIKAVFGFQDRGTQVPLAAALRIGEGGVLRSYEVWGSTSRTSSIDERVELDADGAYVVRRLGEAPVRVRPRAPFAVGSGYAPMLTQDLMLRKWVENGRPATMSLVPEGMVSLESRGRETYSVESNSVELEHVSVRGLAWGREDAWLDTAGKLVAVVTRDAEYDHFEAVREGFVAILPALTTSAGADGVKWLSEVAKSAERGPSGVVALVGAELVDGTGRAPTRDAVIVYDRDKIVAAGPRASVTIPAGATTVDVSGKTIVPGLWDMHAHFQQVEQGAAYLASGVTTVRDLGNILEFVTGIRDAIDAGAGLGPRILVDGLVDGDGARAMGTITVKSAADIAPVLERLKRAGCLEVKIYSSIDPHLIKPIAAEAHRRGMRVVDHVPEGMDVVAALDAGFDGVSHATFLFGPLFAPGETSKLSRSAMRRRIIEARLDDPKLSQVVRTFVAKKAFLDDTLALFDLLNHTDEESGKREPGLAKVPRELRGMFEGVRSEEATERSALFDRYLAFVGELHKRGVPIVAGTDISVPGHSLHRELELYVQAGFTPLEAIQAATIVPARVMHLDKEVGTIEPGKRADLVVLAGNPISDIRNIRKVETVVSRGKSYEPGTLWRLIGFSP
ncbi:MAG TPA: amidohydrolase family protein [Polyangiaceae bacterium]|nr:amidohydrolase family protein [Polyangiaceae bacterium]